MRVAFVADVHVGSPRKLGGVVEVGLNARGQMVLNVLGRALSEAARLGCRWFIVLGDLFDDDHPPPPLIARMQELFTRSHHAGVQVVCLVGNHDQHSATPRDHALAPLVDYARVVERPEVLDLGEGLLFYAVPFQPGEAAGWWPGVADQLAALRAPHVVDQRHAVLGVHLGVSDTQTPVFLRGAPDSLPVDVLAATARALGARHTVAGNWHGQELWQDDGGTVLQVGALAPTGWDNPGVDGYGGLAVLDTEMLDAGLGLTLHRIPGPRFVTVTSPDELTAYVAANRVTGDTLFVRARAAPADRAPWQDRLAGHVGAADLHAFEVAVETDTAEVARATAAGAARAARGLPEAVSEYVTAMPLEAGLDRETVLQHVLGALAAGGGGGRA